MSDMTFEEAVEIYIANAQAEMDANGWVGSVNQPGANESYLKGGIWYLRNINGHLARVGTKSKRVLTEAFKSRDSEDEVAFRICTMSSGDWFVSSLYPDLEESAKKAGGEIDGYDLGEMGELFDVTMGDDCEDPHNDLLKAIEVCTRHTNMLEKIKKAMRT